MRLNLAENNLTVCIDMSSVARPQVDDVNTRPAPPVQDAGKIERPYAEDTSEQKDGTSIVDTAKTAAKGYGDKLQDKAVEAKESLQPNDTKNVVERTAVHERVV